MWTFLVLLKKCCTPPKWQRDFLYKEHEMKPEIKLNPIKLNDTLLILRLMLSLADSLVSQNSNRNRLCKKVAY